MADIKSSFDRSRNMAAIKGKNTKPEIFLRKCLFARGYRYRTNSSTVMGHPDIWLRKYNVAIFVNGCYWHRHPQCKYAYTPKSGIEFWTKKFDNNMNRDQRVMQILQSQNIRYLVIWECTIRKMQKSEETKELILNQIVSFFRSDQLHCEM